MSPNVLRKLLAAAVSVPQQRKPRTEQTGDGLTPSRPAIAHTPARHRP